MSLSMPFTGTSNQAAHGEILAEPNRLILPYHPFPTNATVASLSADACGSRHFSWTPETEVASIIAFAIALGPFAQPFLTALPQGGLR